MNSYKKLNNIFGIVSFVIALVVYTLTMESTASFWDCGEFISAAFKLQVVHPPGAPLFLMLGRFFSLFAGDNLQMVAPMVNFMSATASAFCIMFTFWITTYFGRRILLSIGKKDELSSGETLANMFAGLVGAMALTFSDTFWFSAVEAEVYASSSFFTAITFWAILKWEERANEKHADRWLVLIGYLIGLAIGVHLLNLLVIPAVAFVYYFKKFVPSAKGIFLTLISSGAILLIVQLGIIPGIPSMAAGFDRFFVNSLGMGFGSGVIFFAILFVSFVVFGIYYTQKKGKVLMNTAFLSLVFVVIGYSSYAMVVIRSIAMPPINMNTPDDAYSLVYYLNREQYGDRPLLKGPFYDAKLIDIKEKSKKYAKGKDKYVQVGSSVELVWEENRMTIFPRIYDVNSAQHIQGYKEWTGIKENEKPKFKHNISFFVNYQLGWMYWRYFMWNFSGRQNDEQGVIGPVNGNWLSGIPFIDYNRVGPQTKLPDEFKAAKGRNIYYMIPFVIGLLGLVFHIKNAKHDSAILGLLFLITGIILIMYLNPPPYEPRERDYVFVGSFQVFCSWIGLGVLFLYTLLRKKMGEYPSIFGAFVIGLIAPVLMASQNWDDHDRSGRYLSIDFAKDYLMACPQNAILFTNGDNDTYPLWYAQNVENVRTDVRVVNISLLAASDYANTLKRKEYQSDALNSSFTQEFIDDQISETIEYYPKGLDQNQYYELKELLDFVASDNETSKIYNQNSGKSAKFFPANKFKVTIDKDKAIASGWIKAKDSALVVPALEFGMSGSRIYRNSLMIYDVLANNLYKRPICFTSTTGSETFLGLQNYFQLKGLIYELVPIRTESTEQNVFGRIDTDELFDLFTKKYVWGGMDKPGFFIDDKAQLVPYNVRNYFGRLAEELLIEGKKEKAIEALDYIQKVIPHENLPFGWNMLRYVDLYYQAGDNARAGKLLDLLFNHALQLNTYYAQFKGKIAKGVEYEKQVANYVLEQTVRMAENYDPAKASELKTKMKSN